MATFKNPVCSVLGVLAALFAAVCHGQVATRLPPVGQPPTEAEFADVSTSDDYAEPLVAEPIPPPVAPGEFRLIRNVGATATWLSGGGSDGLGVTEASVDATAIVPWMIYDAPLMITPSFGISALDAPATIELPGEVYRASASIMWMKKSSEKLSFMVGVTPGVSSDFEATENAFRLFGYGAATFQRTPTVQFTLGAAYTGRNDIPVFPVAGIIWTPNEDWRVEIAAPRPRVARRVYCLPWTHAETEDWAYFAGELGGGTWAVERPSGLEDELTIRDFRIVLGYERKNPKGMQGRVELGYVFGRQIEFEDDPTEFEPSDTFMIRTGVSF